MYGPSKIRKLLLGALLLNPLAPVCLSGLKALSQAGHLTLQDLGSAYRQILREVGQDLDPMARRDIALSRNPFVVPPQVYLRTQVLQEQLALLESLSQHSALEKGRIQQELLQILEEEGGRLEAAKITKMTVKEKEKS